MKTPWEALAAALTRLTDRVDALPSFREATLTSFSPPMVQFDTDDAPVAAMGSFSAPVGSRVLTLKLRHYVWILGSRGVAGTLVLNGSTIAHSAAPTDFAARHITIGISDASYPAGIGGVVEVVHITAARTVQRVTYKGDNSTAPSAAWTRSAQGDGTTWGPWGRTTGDTGWVDLSSYVSGGFSAGANSVQGRRQGDDVEIRGNMTAPSVSAGTSNVDWLAGLPTEWRPTTRIAWGMGYASGYALAIFIRTDGTGAVNNRNAFSGSLQFTIRFMRN